MNVVGKTQILLTVLLASVALPALTAEPNAVERMQAFGPEAKALAARAGTWDVVMRFKPAPDAETVVTDDLIAERRMVGTFLQEIMRPAKTIDNDFRRISYLTYNRVEGRWQYVSLDTRFPVGIMPAWSFGRDDPREMTLWFEGLGFVGFGDEVSGRLMRSNYVVTLENENHEFARQYWVQADGSGRMWLAVEYEYRRRP